jgi:hypothetical protein
MDAAWQPIASAPRDGTDVLVAFEIASVWIVRLARYARGDDWVPSEPGTDDGWWSYCNSVSQEQLDGIYTPTLWMHCPDFP